MPSFSATCGPTWAVSPSIACRPQKIRSNAPLFSTAHLSAYEVASVSAAAKARSVRSMTRSAPRYRQSRRTSAALGGPMVITVTVPPCVSRTWSAISSAWRSSGLNIAGSAPRFMVPSLVITSPVTLCVSGTCLTRTTDR